MNAMQKAHKIRKAAAKKYNCKASEIDFGECLRMAHNGEEIEMKDWTFEAKHNGMIFCWGPMIKGRCLLDISTIDGDVIYTKKGLGADLTDGRTVMLGLKISDKDGLAEAIEQAKNNDRNVQPQHNARALYNWIQNEGYDLDGNRVPCPARGIHTNRTVSVGNWYSY